MFIDVEHFNNYNLTALVVESVYKRKDLIRI